MRLFPIKEENLHKKLKAISDPVRLRIIEMLGKERLCVQNTRKVFNDAANVILSHENTYRKRAR